MPISAGTYTVGTSGADYTKWSDAIADIAASFTGNIVLNQIDDVIETADSYRTLDFNGFDLEINNTSPHAGVIGDGYITHMNGGRIRFAQLNSAGNTLFANLQLKYQSGGDLDVIAIYGMGASSGTVTVRDVIIDNDGSTSLMRMFFSAAFPVAYNVYNILHTGYTGSSTLGAITFDGNGSNDIKITNSTVRVTGSGTAVKLTDIYTATIEIFNLIAISSSGIAFDYTGFDAANIPANFMESCASSDATATGGTNAIINFVEADEFESTTQSDPLYLTPKATSQFRESGSSVSQTQDMHGTAYGANPPIGSYVASEPVIPVEPESKCAASMRTLLPPGRLLNRIIGTVLSKLIYGFSVEHCRVNTQIEDYLREAMPDTCTLAGGGLVAWEKTCGIPNACIPNTGTESERRANVLFVLSDIYGPSIPNLEARAALAGFPGTFITERGGVAPFMVEISEVDVDAIGDDAYGDMFTWIVNFPVGSTGTESIECTLEMNKQAHTNVIFNILTGDPILDEDGIPIIDELGFPLEEE